jgi:hypothetical protein
MSEGFMPLLAASASRSNFLRQQAARIAGPGASRSTKIG